MSDQTPNSLRPADANFEQRIRRSFDSQDAMHTVGASITEVSAGKVVIGFDYHNKLTQQHDFIHAGILSTVMDSACGYAAYSLMPADAEVLTIEFKINLLSPAKGDYFFAIGRVTKPGRTITVADGEMFARSGDQDKRIATMTGTLMTITNRSDVTG
jgi:uncharacterized protein (TIGR00369 family)